MSNAFPRSCYTAENNKINNKQSLPLINSAYMHGDSFVFSFSFLFYFDLTFNYHVYGVNFQERS